MTSTSSTDVPSAISADALIIGFGKGGKTLAAKLASTGRTVVVAEASADMYGGTCINIGCLPSKSLILSADRARREGANRTAETREAAFEAAIREKRRVTAMLRDRNYHKLADQDNITVITGRARFTGAHSAEIATADGPVAVAADMFADFGTAVTVLQHSDEFLPREDEDVAAAIRAQLESQGVRFLFGADTKAITSADDGIRLSVSMRGTSDVGSEARLCLSTDAVLVATGRTPNVEGLNLEAAGVELTERGAVKVDDLLRTTADGIWALGDVNGGPQHTYISLDDYRVVWSQLNGSARPYTLSDRRNVPSSTFLHTPYSRVGLNEREAKAAGLDYVVKRLPVATVPKAQVMRRPEGMMKALVENGTDRILGAMLLAAESHEVINIVKLAMDMGAPASTLRDMMFTHPTMAEALNDLFA